MDASGRLAPSIDAIDAAENGTPRSFTMPRSASAPLTAASSDFYASIQRAADVLGQESQKPIEDTPAPAVKGLRAGGRQRHR
jgi:hypothetical protein